MNNKVFDEPVLAPEPPPTTNLVEIAERKTAQMRAIAPPHARKELPMIEKPAKPPKAPRKRPESVILKHNLGTLETFHRLYLRLFCAQEGCKSEFSSSLGAFPANIIHMGEQQGRLNWSFVIHKDNTLGAYCHVHKPPKKSVPIQYGEETF